MKLNIEFEAELVSAEPSTAVAVIEAPAPISSSFATSPSTESYVSHDFYGNSIRRLVAPIGNIEVRYRATVEAYVPSSPADSAALDVDLMTIPSEVLIYTLPSRYCPADEFVRLAEDTFSRYTGVVSRVEAVSTWVNQHIEFAYGASGISTSAKDTMVHRAGVCRDFAHLGITFCRALNIPARYVSGYCLDLEPPDLHAYFQAYVDGAWMTFDPTSSTPRRALAHVAHGRDAADCAWWTSYGHCTTNRVDVRVSAAE